MNKGFIGVFDSGVGGLSVLKKLTAAFPREKFIYLGDNLNAPYGNKSERELLALALANVSYLLSFGVKAIVVACNTMSVNLLEEIKDFSPVPAFGIFPPVETAETSRKKSLLLATIKTAEKYRGLINVRAVGLKNLAGDIERNLFSLDRVELNAHLKELDGETGAYDTLILGCTHYGFIKNRIIDHLKPRSLCDGADLTVHMLSQSGIISKSSDKICDNEIIFIGKCAKINKCFWEKVVINMNFL